MKWSPKRRLKHFLANPGLENLMKFYSSYEHGFCLVRSLDKELFWKADAKGFSLCPRCPLSYDGGCVKRAFCGSLSAHDNKYILQDHRSYTVEFLSSLIRFDAMLEVLEDEWK